MRDFATADLLDQFPETEVLLPGLSTFGGKPSFYGQAQTVTAPEDNSYVRKALEKSGENRVLVVDGGGSTLCALLGDQLAQLAFDMDYSENTTLEFGIQYQTSDSVQVPGWTRVTQELVDSGQYITGTPSALNDLTAIVGADRLTPQESGAVGAFAPFFLNNSYSKTTNFCF